MLRMTKEERQNEIDRLKGLLFIYENLILDPQSIAQRANARGLTIEEVFDACWGNIKRYHARLRELELNQMKDIERAPGK